MKIKFKKFIKDLKSVLNGRNIRLMAVISFILLILFSVYLSINKLDKDVQTLNIGTEIYESDITVEDYNILTDDKTDIMQIKYQLSKPMTYYTSCFIYDKDMNILSDKTFCSAPVVDNIGIIKTPYQNNFIIGFNNDQNDSRFYYVDTVEIAKHKTSLIVKMLDDNFLKEKIKSDELEYTKKDENAYRYKAEIEVYAFAINDLNMEIKSLKYQYKNTDKKDSVKRESITAKITQKQNKIESLRKECLTKYSDIMKILGLKI